MITTLTRWLLTLLAFIAVPGFAADANQSATLLRPAQVWTAGEAPHAGWVILTVGSRIQAVGPASAVQVPAGTQTIELRSEERRVGKEC